MIIISSPKNYDKVETRHDDTPHKWEHRNQDITVTVTKAGRDRWMVEAYRGMSRIDSSSPVSNKDKARRFAVNWMRDNPNP